jgi:hypothetical protein
MFSGEVGWGMAAAWFVAAFCAGVGYALALWLVGKIFK